MADKKKKLNEGRREFLRGSAVVGAGVVAVSGLSGQAVASVDIENTEKPTEEGYRLTKHILEYYKTAAH
ncbi:MAG: twin-arginine translocation signal domain-containing protein [Gammaproteobacteria bacterium]|nr:twin-arginine translocation signal domain-containing protein [Gammaproteobacteria bacterium]